MAHDELATIGSGPAGITAARTYLNANDLRTLDDARLLHEAAAHALRTLAIGPVSSAAKPLLH